ncbi:MAG: hypothetical protein ABSB59_40720 [Streptosporangiaceae bacterium]|jgi:transcriptional regulator with XRE-family HTH domain
MERTEIGAWLRAQREARCWSRLEMARQLIRAAHTANDQSIVGVDNLCHNIYRWERGAVNPGERYRLYYCHVLGIPLAAFGDTAAGKAHALILPRESDGEIGNLLNLLDVERGVSLRAESSSIAMRIARELSEGMTEAGRIAMHDFLNEIARSVKWPAN